jgi:hypothetical protein
MSYSAGIAQSVWQQTGQLWFYVLRGIQSGSGAHPGSYSITIVGSFPGG